MPDGYSVDFECDRVEAVPGAAGVADRPFFLYYNISPPHCPMSDAPEKYTTMYRPEEIPIRPNVDLTKRLPDQDHWFKVYRWDYRYYNFHLPYTEDLPADFTLQRVIAEYYGMTTWVDDAVGRMLAAWRQTAWPRTPSSSSPPITATTWAATAGCRRGICTRSRCGFR